MYRVKEGAQPTFSGAEGYVDAEEWLIETDDLLHAFNILIDDGANMVKVHIRGTARVW